MNKNVIFGVLNAVAFLAAAILWVLSLVLEEFAWFNLGYGIAIVCAILGVTCVLGANKKLDVLMRKSKVLLAVSFWIVGAIALVFAVIFGIFTAQNRKALPKKPKKEKKDDGEVVPVAELPAPAVEQTEEQPERQATTQPEQLE